MNKGNLNPKQVEHFKNCSSTIAYFSMEIGFRNEIPTYSGGLGILAGDTLKSFADLGISAVAITLLSRKGYFYQTFNEDLLQVEKDYQWSPEELLTKTNIEFIVKISDRNVHVNVWTYRLKGVTGKEIPIYFLDTNNPKNDERDRTITDHLYGGDLDYRLKQEIILGIGGIRLLRKLGLEPEKYHLNEGHASFLILELYEELRNKFEEKEIRSMIKHLCSFTTHTPVPAGHDSFEKSHVIEKLPYTNAEHIIDEACEGSHFNMTKLALQYSKYVNAVSRKHKFVTQQLFPGYNIDYITNGVHSTTWVGKHHAALFDKYIVDWRTNPLELRNAQIISSDDILTAHDKAKQELIDFVNTTSNSGLQCETFTIGFARRATGYKRAELIFSNIERLKKISRDVGKIQIIFAGKAHPRDLEGKKIIQRIRKLSKELDPSIKLVFIENYNMYIGQLMTAGVDLWLNTPQRPLEASGTSGMKAAHNGVPSLSVLDGWWLEGCIEGVTGWAINGEESFGSSEETNNRDADSLYYKLSEKIIPLFYQDKESFAKIMKHTIATNASYFNTHRQAKQYLVRSYIQP